VSSASRANCGRETLPLRSAARDSLLSLSRVPWFRSPHGLPTQITEPKKDTVRLGTAAPWRTSALGADWGQESVRVLTATTAAASPPVLPSKPPTEWRRRCHRRRALKYSRASSSIGFESARSLAALSSSWRSRSFARSRRTSTVESPVTPAFDSSSVSSSALSGFGSSPAIDLRLEAGRQVHRPGRLVVWHVRLCVDQELPQAADLFLLRHAAVEQVDLVESTR
jgi:hypothetical protein